MTVTNSLAVYHEEVYSESAEWVEPNIVVKENDTYWYEDAYGRPLDPEGRKQPAQNYRKPKNRHVELVTVTNPVSVTENALAIPFNPSMLSGVVAASTVQLTVDRANEALQAMRKFQREIGDKPVPTAEERQKMVELVTQVQETQADMMIANRNRAWQQAGIFPGMQNKRIAHVHAESIGKLPEALADAIKKRLT